MIEIRRALASEAQTLADLATRTFLETFAKDNRKEDMDLYVAETFSAKKQLSEIQDRNRFIEIAWIENQAVGFLHLLNGGVDPAVQGARPIEVLRLYADAQWHGKGVGAALMKRSIEIARQQGFQTVWLGVWERNLRALAFYKKYGFKMVGQHVFRVGHDDQLDVVMAREI